MDFVRQLVLVNKLHPIDNDYEVDLCNIKYSDKQADRLIIDDLNRMLQAARDCGYMIYVCSAYRSIEYQRQLFEKKVANVIAEGYDESTAKKLASEVVMPPGYSEHHTGLAVDIVSVSDAELELSQINTDENKWLLENAHRFGFILRYPAGKEDVTGVMFEPWHFRYVGKYVANYMYRKGYTLEEFLSETLH